MNAEYNTTNLGDISVDNNVIKNIALKAATEIPGVHEIEGSHFGKILSLLKRGSAQGVKLEFAATSELNITLKLAIEYGVNIPYIAGEVQENVKKRVEHMTGLTVTEVAIKITCMGAKTPTPVKEDKEDLENELGESYPLTDEFASE